MLEAEFDSDGAGGYAAIFALTMPEGFSLTPRRARAEALPTALRRAMAGHQPLDLHWTPGRSFWSRSTPTARPPSAWTADEVSTPSRPPCQVAGRPPAGQRPPIWFLGITGEITFARRLRAFVLRGMRVGPCARSWAMWTQITRGPRLPLGA